MGTRNYPIEMLKNKGYKINSNLPFTLSNGAEFYIGEKLSEAAIICLMPENESIYFLDKIDLRKMTETAKTYNIQNVILYTNFGVELHSKHESPQIVGLHKLIKIDNYNNEQTFYNPYTEGDKISWSAIVNGKVTRLKGYVSSIVGETMCCIGKCVATGNRWNDYVSIHDKSVSRLK